MVSVNLGGTQEEALAVLRDELIVVHERDAWQDLTEQSGTWQPNDLRENVRETGLTRAFADLIERVALQGTQADEPVVDDSASGEA